MALQVAPLNHPLEGLTDFLRESSGLFGTLDGAELELVGPFPSFSADPLAIAAGRWAEIEQVGWRGLARSGDHPAGVVDIMLVDGAPRYSVRGADAAVAMERALEVCSDFELGKAVFEVRWFTLPPIYLTAVWLQGDENVFIPTRTGGSHRPKPEIVSRNQIEALVRELIATMVEQGGAPEIISDTVRPLPGSRSGM